MNSDLDFFFQKTSIWQECYTLLRNLLLECGLTETLKWGVPCYTFQSKNVVLIHGFKEYCALLFHKGTLLQDEENILIQQTKNVQSARQIRFTDAQQIANMETTLKAYVFEAIEVERAGLEVKLKKTKEFPMAEEFKAALAKNPDLKTAFEALTPGRQRGYLLHFSQPKQSKTRTARVEKCTPLIIAGKGLNDR